MRQVPDDLSAVHRQIMSCTWCDLSRSRTLAVPGAGDPEARVMFVGEGPGFHEDRQGLPFVGAAGRLLDQLLEGIGLDRSEVFITNIVKCRPPGNRDPLPHEIEACRPYLVKQVELIDCEIIVTLGRLAMAQFLGPGLSISRVHGQARRRDGRLVIPMLHPAAALRQERYRQDLELDFAVLKRALDEGIEPMPESRDDREPPEQLSLL
ncbi:MAG: uracil-DNA glycosylase [Anaerolineae bacterium]|nr:uracil-DNA glycosylase [Anaerolineae bacterium]